MTVTRLHFVYNVDATPQALAKDFVHRLVDPGTYPCKLCDLTYGRFVKKPGWQVFLWSLPVKTAFYTRDRFIRRYPAERGRVFPVVLAEDARGAFRVFIAAEEFAAIADLAALEREVVARLNHQTVDGSRSAR